MLLFLLGLYLGGALRHFQALWWMHVSYPLPEEDRPPRKTMLWNWFHSTVTWPLLLLPSGWRVPRDAL